ncbi:hypothetical protein Y5W_00149 [Alcanivorax sp. 521-1]|uniref:Uncharacterized protein n=1 Tax=Alloalcanivorax profundimaris TaxID=2735259 RepID=A0ABS0ALE9_9GAMM|nr:hypothetical protein [Alloalcanivorax profundimaris]MBF5054855.1 hypothetical protein [Alloalcanivorax profundimaris]
MQRWILALLTLSLTGPALAVPPENPDQVNGMIDGLETLADQGRALKQDLDPADQAAVKACRAEHGALQEQAVALRDSAAKLPQLAYRVNLTMAASAAAGCVACDQGADQCDSVAPALDRVRHQLNAPAEKQ